jgi:hypothetical protein
VTAVEKVWLNVAPGLAYVVIRGSRVEAALLACKVGVHRTRASPGLDPGRTRVVVTRLPAEAVSGP